MCIKKNNGVNDEGVKYQQQILCNSVDRYNKTVMKKQSELDSIIRMELADRLAFVCAPYTQINENIFTTKSISASSSLCACVCVCMCAFVAKVPGTSVTFTPRRH